MEQPKSNISSLLKSLIAKRGYLQKEFAEQKLGISLNAVRNALYSDNFRVSTLKTWADALGYDVVLIDRKTGEQHKLTN